MAVLPAPIFEMSASSPRTVFRFVKQPSWQTARACGASAEQASTSAVKNKPCRKGNRVIEFVVREVFVFIKQTFPFPRLVTCPTESLKEGRSCREKRSLPDSDVGFAKSCQESRQLGNGKIIDANAELG